MTRLSDERDMEQVVRSWLRDHSEHPADRNRQIGRIVGRVDETHQRRGAWRFLPFGAGRRMPDRDDAELYADGIGGVGIRVATARAAMVVVAVMLVFVIGAAFLAWIPRSVLPPGASPTPTVHPQDVQLLGKLAGVWSGELTGLEDVTEVYAADAVHTALWHDRAERAIGAGEIWRYIQLAEAIDGGDWVPIADAATGERRYLGTTQGFGGVACVLWVRDERIARHDCILPGDSTGITPAGWTESESTLATQAAIAPDLYAGWSHGDLEAAARVVDADIEHHVALDNHEYILKGLDLYVDNMGRFEIVEVAPSIALPAPAGEVRWTDYGSLAGGTLCVFQARDGLITRHDCIVPAKQSNQPPTPAPAATGA